MNDFAIKAAVAVQNSAVRFAHNVRNIRNAERGDSTLIVTIILIAVFLIAAIAFSTVVLPALKSQGNNIGSCISKISNNKCSGFTG
jgi:hypothetical protein